MGSKTKSVKKSTKVKSTKRVPAADRLLPKDQAYPLPSWAIEAARRAIMRANDPVGVVIENSSICVLDRLPATKEYSAGIGLEWTHVLVESTADIVPYDFRTEAEALVGALELTRTDGGIDPSLPRFPLPRFIALDQQGEIAA